MNINKPTAVWSCLSNHIVTLSSMSQHQVQICSTSEILKYSVSEWASRAAEHLSLVCQIQQEHLIQEHSFVKSPTLQIYHLLVGCLYFTLHYIYVLCLTFMFVIWNVCSCSSVITDNPKGTGFVSGTSVEGGATDQRIFSVYNLCK